MSEINRLVIVGGGTAGWISAALLANQRPELKLSLIESPEIGTIGVGEATIPPFLDLLNTLGIDLSDFIRKTQSTFKLGIQFTDWHSLGSQYIHPFGHIGQKVNGIPFYHYWHQAKKNKLSSALMDYSPSAQMAKANVFYVPSNAKNTPIEAAGYALHIDAGLAAKYFKEYACLRGVEHIAAKVTDVVNEGNIIKSLTLDDKRQIRGDFFIDCSGFRALLIGQAVKSEYTDWSHLLTVKRAVTLQTISDLAPKVYTESRAQQYGWTWHIPLQHRIGNGYVFDSNLCSDEEALRTLRENIHGDECTEPRFLNFKSGVRKQSWSGNCLAVGLSSGFLEPLESTAIHMITRSLKLFLRFFPSKIEQVILAEELNSMLYRDFEEIRDFLLLHYCLTTRKDSEFWQHYQKMQLPESLCQRIALFNERGILREDINDLFLEASWISVFEGMGMRPKEKSALIPAEISPIAAQILEQAPTAILGAVQQLPSHKDFIEQHCKAIEPN